MLRAIVRSEGLTAIIATHDPMLIDLADRTVELSDGRIVERDPWPGDDPAIGARLNCMKHMQAG